MKYYRGFQSFYVFVMT